MNFEIQYLNPIRHGREHLYEIYLETDEEIDPEDFSSSWQENLVYETGKIVPNVKDMTQRLEKNLYLTVQIEIEGAPPKWSLEDKNGNIGLFIGLQNPSFNGCINLKYD